VKFYDQHGGVRVGGGELTQMVEYGKDAVAPIMSRDGGWTLIGWDKPFTNITAYTAVRSHFARIVVDNTTEWAASVNFTIESDDSSPVQYKFRDSDWSEYDTYYDIYSHESVNVDPRFWISMGGLETSPSVSVYARVAWGGEWVDGKLVNYTWVNIAPAVINNIDILFPTAPSFTYRLANPESDRYLSLNITPGTDNESGVRRTELRIGLNSEWHAVADGVTPLIPNNNTYIALRTIDNVGNISAVRSLTPRIGIVDLVNKDKSVLRRYVKSELHEAHTADGEGVGHISRKIALRGYYDAETGFSGYIPYISYETGSAYKGCGVKAAQIFTDWYGFDMPQGVVNDYVETTDFTRYLDWLVEDTWADTDIFTTPAQLESGMQSIMNLDYRGYSVERYSPNSSKDAIALIERYLAAGHPVAILANDGSHWQVITESNVSREQNGDIYSAVFAVNDNGGRHERTWYEIDYFFEDNTSAELARDVGGYTSYWDTIISIGRVDPIFIPSAPSPATGDVTVRIVYPADATFKSYKIGDGNWEEYTAPIVLSANAAVHARYFVDGAMYGVVSIDIGDISHNWAGDVNHSGTVELADAVLTLQVLSGVIPAQEVFNDADVNGDGRLGLPEVLYILQTIAGRRM
jgi:hypothetical protein